MTVTPDDIAVELGRTAPTQDSVEYAQWQRWIADALLLIGARLGDVTQLDQGRLDYVVRQAVAAHVRRPDDATQVSVAVDDGSVSRTYRSSSGRVGILDEWWQLLAPPDSLGGAFSITPVSSSAIHADICSLAFGALYCSCGADIAGIPIFEAGDEY